MGGGEANNTMICLGKCHTHHKVCDRRAMAADIEVAGPPCVLFSSMGGREGVANAAEYKCHESWTKMRKMNQEPVIVFENVWQYPVKKLLIKELGDLYDFQCVVVSPHNFGSQSIQRTTVQRCYTT